MNTDTQAPFTYKDACIALNPHVGGNPATAQEALTPHRDGGTRP